MDAFRRRIIYKWCQTIDVPAERVAGWRSAVPEDILRHQVIGTTSRQLFAQRS